MNMLPSKNKYLQRKKIFQPIFILNTNPVSDKLSIAPHLPVAGAAVLPAVITCYGVDLITLRPLVSRKNVFLLDWLPT